MTRPTRPLVWHQLRFALPLAQDAAVALVERILADGSLGRVVLELRAAGGQAVWAVGSSAGERLISVVRELVPVRQSGMDHRAVARIVLAMARQMAADEAVESAADDAASSGAGVCAKSERGTSDGRASARDDAAVPWTGAHSGQSARGDITVGRCAANEPVSASPSGCLAGRCSHQRHDGTHHSTHESATADCSSSFSSDEAAAVSSTPGGTP